MIDLSESFSTLFWVPLTDDMLDVAESFATMFWEPLTADMIDLSESFSILFWVPLTDDMLDVGGFLATIYQEPSTADMHDITEPLVSQFEEKLSLSGSSVVDNSMSAYNMAMKNLYAPREWYYQPPSQEEIEKIRRQLFKNEDWM